MKSSDQSGNPADGIHEVAPELRLICDALSDGIIVVDGASASVIHVNKSACSMLGRSESDLKSATLSSLLSSQDFSRADELMSWTSSKTQLHFRDIPFSAAGEDVFSADITIVPLTNQTGRQAALLLKPSESRRSADRQSQILSSIATQSTEGIAVIDMEGHLQFINNAFAEMHGYKPDELLGRHVSVFHTPGQMAAVNAANKQIADTGEFTGEIWHVKRDGTEFPTAMHNSLLRDDSGEIIGMIGTLRDITDSKKAEKDMQESETRTRAILRTYPDLMFQFSSDGTFLDYIAPTEDLYVEERAFLGKNVQDVMPPEVATVSLHAIENALRTNVMQTCEYELLISGELRNFECRMNATGENEVLAIIRDITERKQAHKALEDSEQRYRKLTEVAFGGYAISRAGKVAEASERFAELFGYQMTELIGMNVIDLFAPEQREDVSAKIEADYDSPYESVCLRRDGTAFPVEACGKIVQYGGAKARITAIRDITTRERAIVALRESEERYRTLYETMAQGVVYQDADGRITSVNPTAERILGLSFDEMSGRTSHDSGWRAIHEDGSEFTRDAYPSTVALSTGKEVHKVVMGIFNPRIEDWVWISVNAVPQFKPGDDKPFQVYSTFSDITDRKKAENALKKSQAELEARNMALVSMIDVSGSLHRSLDFDDVVKAAVEAMMRYSQSPSVGMFSVNREANRLELLHARGFTDATVKAAETMPIESSLTGKAVLQNDIMVSPELTEDNRVYTGVQKHLADQGFVTIVSVPISHQDEVKGAMVLIFREEHPLDQRERETLLSIGRSIGLAMSNAEHLAQLKAEIAERKRAELEVQKERDRAQNYLDIAGAIFVVLNNRGEVTLINRKGCEILGFEERDILNRNWFNNFVPENSRTETKATFEELMAGHIEPAEYYENPILNRFGEERLIAWHNALLVNDKGRIVATLSSGEDITERQRADEALRSAYEQLSVERKALVEKNIALREVLEHIDDERKQIRAKIAETVDQVLTPAMNRLVNSDGTVNRSFLDLLKNSLQDLASTSDEILYLYSRLSPREVEICNLIRNGATSQEIADALFISLGTVKKHREKVRKKLKLANKNINLSAFLKGFKGV
ncbi:MAG: PAS domain S-box protein [Candidatus Zixiibacteriota bacterium]